ncbi:hypothetical protein [Macrococcoides caseolyticum]|uniref:Uncharacterized protein n=2 Tax=Macrococcoides caseolyticum TaxID=69966 RepID=A0A2N0VSF9_9STAP|nr:hypothetical protein [Macrococcus caseolyticus]ARQ03891.1 hypothetical protein CA207_06350 [Macrococcus caseolyticus]PKD98214.1 hypothetical protein CW719_08885 [Macrococcus caseolyticus]PKE07116.1 hypothetical protein CW692_04920 [Macrococcus caseolyticus]PKE12819.1 hypothetical protein CW685_02065 [Macrococcus caseolyticus]PKE17680.1 hypothetical protein CW718_03190 [Macrococcus caseolyticus]
MKNTFNLKYLPGWCLTNNTKIPIRLVENKSYIAVTKPIYKSHSILDIIEFNNGESVTFTNPNNNNQIAIGISHDAKEITINPRD